MKARYVGIRKGVHVFLTTEQGEKLRLSQIARAKKAKVVFVNHIEDPMVDMAIQLGGIAHDDTSYNFARTGVREWRKKRLSPAASTTQ
jgi:hypothetical protein